MSSNNSLSDLYGNILAGTNIVSESTIKKGGNDFKEGAPLIKGGPQKSGGFHQALNDESDLSEEDEEDTSEDVDDVDFEEDEETDETEDGDEEEVVKESQKSSKTKLNTPMRKNLTFDNLYKKIIKENFNGPGWGDASEDAEDDIDALGLGDASPDSDLEDDFGGEGGDEVTLTLDRATAQTLYDLLGAVVGAGEDVADDVGEVEDELGDEGVEDDGLNFEEDEETIGAKDSKGGGQQHKLQQKGNKVSGKPQPSGGGFSDYKPTDKVGNDGDHGHAIHSGKKPNDGKNNKVSNLKQGADFFK